MLKNVVRTQKTWGCHSIRAAALTRGLQRFALTTPSIHCESSVPSERERAEGLSLDISPEGGIGFPYDTTFLHCYRVRMEHVLQVREVLEDIVEVHCDDPRELAATFLRFQEHYESPEFRGKIFTLEEYRRWYVAHSPRGQATGEFTYEEDWTGFNIPSEILEPFYEGKFDPLSERERMFLQLFAERRKRLFYVIGTSSEADIRTLKHEVAHGLFYTRPEYRQEVLSILSGISSETRSKIQECFVRSGGYHPSVFTDETHAYLLSNLNQIREVVDSNGDELSAVAQALEENFRRASLGSYCGGSSS